ncbi:MAG: protein translocase subunit SecF [Patescibacteria group bacterium]
MYKIIQKRNWLFGLSFAILVPGLVSLFLFGLRPAIDFTGGSRLTVSFSAQRPAGPDVAKVVSELGYGIAAAQTSGDRDLIINLPNISNDQRQKVVDTLNEKYGVVSESSFETIGPTVGKELLKRAVTSIVIVLLAIIIYISWAFRKVRVGPVPSWVYGASAVVALAHDILIVVGVFSILGHYAKIEIDSLFVTALLTVLGFSVHDTIVVFDRIRERLLVGAESSYEETVNVSLNQTLIRSLNTSLTTLLVLAALYLFGGITIRNFVLALLIGIASGTYSSIFVASPLLVVYDNWKRRRRR